MNDYKIYTGDARAVLKTLPDNSVHCAVTSPPYFGLRDYNVDGQIGLEKTPEQYVRHLVRVFRELRRVLRPDGTFWLNIADSYANDGKWGGSTGGKHVKSLHGKTSIGREKSQTRLKQKDRIGIPHRLVFALQADGWYWRDEIIWYAPNKMPESVTDRCTKAHEFIFLLTKLPRYFFDNHAIRERATPELIATCQRKLKKLNGQRGDVVQYKQNQATQTTATETSSASPNLAWSDPEKPMRLVAGSNKRSVWTIPTQPNKESHFAAYPRKLVLPCILAGTSEKGCCPECGAPWKRILEKKREATRPARESKVYITPPLAADSPYQKHNGDICGNRDPERHVTASKTIGWKPTCNCGHKNTIPCTVLDMFGGIGTTVAVALSHNRRAITIELNPEYVGFIEAKIKKAIDKKGFGL